VAFFWSSMWPDETWFKQYVILVVYRSLFILLASSRFHALPNVCNDSSAMSKESLSKDCEGRLFPYLILRHAWPRNEARRECGNLCRWSSCLFSLTTATLLSAHNSLLQLVCAYLSYQNDTHTHAQCTCLPCTTHELLPILMHTVPLWFWRMKSMIWGQPQWTAWWRMVAFDRSLVPTSAGRHESHVTHGVLQISPVTTQCKSTTNIVKIWLMLKSQLHSLSH